MVRAATLEYMQEGTRQTVNRPINKLYPVELKNEKLELESKTVNKNIEEIRILFIDDTDIPQIKDKK